MGKQIYLTFDDGPIPETTPLVLSILKEYNAKATFFCIGANIEKHPAIFRQVIDGGHSIGNHTYNHLNGWKTNNKEYLDNIEKCKMIMDDGRWNPDSYREVNGNVPSSHFHSSTSSTYLFRPPYGKMKRSQYSNLKSQYSLVMWDVLSGDFDQTISQEKCLKHVLSKTREGSIVVFHDSLKAKRNLLFALPRFLEHFSKQGFIFPCLTSSVRYHLFRKERG